MSMASKGRVAVIGAGTMGSGIAQVCAAAGYDVTVRDLDDAMLERATATVRSSLDRLVSKAKITAEERDRIIAAIHTTRVFDDAVRDADLVGLDVRLAILEHLHREIGEQFRPPAILRQMVRAGRLGKKSGEGFYKWPEAEKK